MNPADVFLNQKMDTAEKKLRLAEKANGVDRQKALAAQIKMIKSNNKIMRKEMTDFLPRQEFWQECSEWSFPEHSPWRTTWEEGWET